MKFLKERPIIAIIILELNSQYTEDLKRELRYCFNTFFRWLRNNHIKKFLSTKFKQNYRDKNMN